MRCHLIVPYTNYFNFPIFIHFTNQIALKQSLAHKLNLVLKFNSIDKQKNILLWMNMEGHRG